MKIKRFLSVVVFIGVMLMLYSSANAMSLKSTSINDGGIISSEYIYNGYGCSGKNLSPDLSWSEAPDGTKGYALTVYDPDAPTDHGWWHWLVVNIPSDITEFSKGQKITAPMLQTKNDFGFVQYGGPCPPVGHGEHRYIFTIYALDVPLINVKSDSLPSAVNRAIKQHSLTSASITAKYGR